MDIIKGNLGKQATQQAPMTDEGERVRKLLGAKTGKAGSQAASGVAQSNLAEASAVDQTRLGQGQLNMEAQMQGQQLAQTQQGLEQQEQTQRAGIDLQQKANTLQNKVQTDQLLGDLSRDKSALSLERDKSKLEQLSHNLALQDKQYIDNLQKMGQMNRFDNELTFKTEMTRTIFSDSNDLLNEDLSRRAFDAQSSRDWNEYLAANNLAFLLDTSKNQAKAANEAARWSAISGLASAGAQAYAAGGEAQPSEGKTVFTGDINPDSSFKGYA